MDRKLPAEVKRDIDKVRIGLMLSYGVNLLFIGFCLYTVLLFALSGNYIQVAVIGLLVVLMLVKWFPAGIYHAVECITSGDLVKERYALVESRYSSGLRLLERLPFADNYWKAAMLFQIGRMRMFQGFFDGAETPMERGLEIALSDRGFLKGSKNSPFVAMLHANLGVAYVRAQRIEEAKMQFEQAMQAFPEESIISSAQKTLIAVCKAYVNISIGASKFEMGDLDGAYEQIVIGMTVLQQNAKPPAPLQLIHVRQTLMHSHAMLALIEMRKGQLREANEHFQRFMHVTVTDAPLLTSTHLRVLALLADEYLKEKQYEAAEKILDLGYRVGLESPHHPDALLLLDVFERLLVVTERKDEVADMRLWLRVGKGIVVV
jgi:tetratricopeptide (TPR) repeat protein